MQLRPSEWTFFFISEWAAAFPHELVLLVFFSDFFLQKVCCWHTAKWCRTCPKSWRIRMTEARKKMRGNEKNAYNLWYSLIHLIYKLFHLIPIFVRKDDGFSDFSDGILEISLHYFGCEHRCAGDSDGDDGEDEDRRKARDFFESSEIFTSPSTKSSERLRRWKFESSWSAFEFAKRFRTKYTCDGKTSRVQSLQNGPTGPYG